MFHYKSFFILTYGTLKIISRYIIKLFDPQYIQCFYTLVGKNLRLTDIINYNNVLLRLFHGTLIYKNTI